MGLSCGPFTQLSGSSLKDNEWSPPQWKLACTPSWMSPPNASSESSSSKREELLNPSPPDTNPWKIKKVLLFVFAPLFCLPRLNWIATNFPPLFSKTPSGGEGKNFFFSHFRKNSISRRATVGSPLVHTFLVPTIFLLGKHIIFITLWSGLFLFLLFQQENPVVWLHSYVDGVFHNLIYSLTEIV